jgi:cellulose synthase/poly-beta-1,6-N-acetylglucosamine synthase-like glycosyltransferase
VTIYDAEDLPDPQQLRRVVARFRAEPEDVVCVQCRLNYYNRDRNLLTRLFSIEYASWFDFMLPGLEALKLPIPLGGTSNHIARERLMQLGEWDPYNVTEDADLGVRLAVAKYRTLTSYSLTMEEAPSSLWAWMKQRSRWVKGYMQTWLVHMRRPVKLYQKLGSRGFWGFQLFIGGPCFVFLSSPILLSVSLLWGLGLIHPHHPLMPTAIISSLMVLGYGVVMHYVFARKVVQESSWPKMHAAMVVFPFYWILHSLASFRGLWQLITRPHYWDKTEHGVG